MKTFNNSFKHCCFLILIFIDFLKAIMKIILCLFIDRHVFYPFKNFTHTSRKSSIEKNHWCKIKMVKQ